MSARTWNKNNFRILFWECVTFRDKNIIIIVDLILYL